MSGFKELSYDMLRRNCDSTMFTFENTSEIDPFVGIIGQERAIKAMEFGLKIKTRGYNLFMSGATGTGKTSYAACCIKDLAKDNPVPDDWCYVHNFDKPEEPVAINLPVGIGKTFCKDMEEFVKVLQMEISKVFDSDDYEEGKNQIVKEFDEKRNILIEKLNEDAEEQGFKVRKTEAGIYFLPIVEGKPISEQEYGELDEEIKQEITEKSSVIQKETVDIIRKIKNISKESDEKVEEWENKVALFAVGFYINDLKDKYKQHEKIIYYLEKVQEDILKNLNDFIEDDVPEGQQAMMAMPWLMKATQSPVENYKVNLFVDNSELKGAPVIVDYNPTYFSLMGKIEYENEFGSVTTNYTMIKKGLLHAANGGYIILQAKDILSSAYTWEALKRVLKTKEISITNGKESSNSINVSTLKPQPIPIHIKVILVGSAYVYQMLLEYEEDFKKLFKIKVDFDEEMVGTDENIVKLAGFISSFCNREDSLHFHKSGVAKVVEYSSRLIEDQNKLSTRFNDIVEILSESCAWAEIDHETLVYDRHVDKAIVEKNKRSDKYDTKLLELISEGTIMIDTSGAVTGQINGLSILDMGDYAFGKPSRITANTFMGESGIVNIEREVDMSGTSHTKGVLILSGYIGQKYAQDMPMSLSCSLCFEQLYSGVDGDSASSAELYAILSSLSDVPIKQSLAVTGSVNQKGEIQPIGGVTHKIEGFYELCKLRGLEGSHGVLIPHQNVRNLALKDEVIEAVQNGLFHIYPITTIDEGIEILTDMQAGIKDSQGIYPEHSINYKVNEKLQKYAKTVAGYGKK